MVVIVGALFYQSSGGSSSFSVCVFFFFSFCNGKCSMVDAWYGFAGQALLIGICNGKAARFGAGHFWLWTTLVTLLLSWR